MGNSGPPITLQEFLGILYHFGNGGFFCVLAYGGQLIRAGVFIGVDKAGKLQKLNDAAAGAERMHDWALSQGMVDRVSARLITDKNGGRVTPDEIYDVVFKIIDGAGADQLIVYFAGHGVNINRGEQWLLSDAPVRANAAVNLAGSVELARYCGIRHVVFISDACRVAPAGIQAQQVRGSDIFPNETISDKAKPVDQFFACVLGRTAAEIKDPAIAAGGYCALYTTEVAKALSGRVPEVLDRSDTPNDEAFYVKPVRLEEYLERAVPARVRELHLENRVNQSPDAILTAHTNWISRVAAPRPQRSRPAIPPPTPAPNLLSLTDTVVRAAVEGPAGDLIAKLGDLRLQGLETTTRLVETVETVAAPFGPDHMESTCGVKVRGSRITHFTAAIPSSDVELLGPEGQFLRVWRLNTPVSVVLRFSDDRGTVIPALPGYLATLTFEDGELVDVGYEPSANTGLWNDYAVRADEVRSLRAVAASASHNGRFRLDTVEDPFAIARKMQYAKTIDPTLAIYAAYAYHDLQRIDRIREMISFLRPVLAGNALFDLELLTRSLVNTKVDLSRPVVPFIPLFSQGWHLLRANRVRLHPALAGIDATMRESVWSLFEPRGVDMLERTLMSEEVR